MDSVQRRGGGNGARERARRAALIGFIAALHIILILLLARGDPRAPPPTLNVVKLLALSESSSSAPEPQQIPVPPSPAPQTPQPEVHPLLLSPIGAAAVPSSPASASAGSGAGAAGCALAQQTAEAIERDPAALAELDALPPGLRTEADAVMLWNGQWMLANTVPPGVPAGSLRRAVEQVVMAAPAECRDADAIGPQFIPIPDNGRTTMLVVGSGAWHWADLLAECRAAVGNANCSPAIPLPKSQK